MNISKEREILTTIFNYVGVEKFNTTLYIPISVTKMTDRFYRSTGQFNITIGNGKIKSWDRLVRRTDKNGNLSTEKLDEISKFINSYIETKTRLNTAKEKANDIKNNNIEIADSIRDEFKNVSTKYIASYSEYNSYVVPSSTEEGKVKIQYNFGEVDMETAKKIIGFIASLNS